ncbi:MAG: methionyl-tRNA formyltransferase [Pseudomonadota bacterium]|nr:methionyl-tRNA formyltransferase [Pseudomonadota bacterium]
MRLVFAGTPVFAARALQALLEAGHEVAAVLCQPDRPAGRGQKLGHGPVKALALAHGLPVLQPASLRDAGIQATLAALHADVWVVAAYGLLLPPEILAQPRFGCLNIHASLLPRWRGAAPIQRALLAGDAETGVDIMQMEAGLDTGPVLREGRLAITAHETGGSLHDRLAALGAELVVATLAQLPEALAQARAQTSEGVLYAAKLSKDEARLDWRQAAALLDRVVRAFDPVPGARLHWDSQLIRVGAAETVPASEVPAPAPGTVLALDGGVQVQTGQGVLRLLRLQRPGGRMLPAREFLQSCPWQPGMRLD